MNRGSDKHGSRLDDEMARETDPLVRGAPVEPRVEESMEKEPAGPGEPAVDARITALPRDDTGQLTDDEVEARSQIARHLPRTAFPGDRSALLAGARDMSAPDEVLVALASLPDRRYRNVQDVWRELGGRIERRT